MDPFLEVFWHDVHTTMMVYLSRELQMQLPDGLFARIQGEERLTVDGGEGEMERHLEIIEMRGGGKVVTAIEVLSPRNKGNESDAYRTKSRLCRQAGINLVEIDLLRGGQHVLAIPREEFRAGKPGPYAVCVTRAGEAGVFRVWHIGLLQRLPAIAIPLRLGDREAVVDLQPLLDLAYRDGRYDRQIHYGKPLDPPLPPEALALIEDWQRERGALAR